MNPTSSRSNPPIKAVLPIKVGGELFRASYSDRGLARIEFPSRGRRMSSEAKAVPRELRSWHAAACQAVQSLLQGRAPGSLPPLDLGGGSNFRRRVWQALQSVPAGKTVGYGELAALLGNPKAARAVGAACGANPIPLLIPCHRVVSANGSLGGFSGGLEWKRRLLAAEKPG